MVGGAAGVADAGVTAVVAGAGVLQVLASRQGFQAQGLLPVLASRQWFQVQGCWRMEPPPVLLVRFQAGWHCRQLERQVSHCLLGESG
ncbi:MAG: hypothetical protein HZT40_17630 [Candidatus Thiothrix singaporensis]|uniref:Uncharacterized protein n=1 Tax=Candidatus Thiothrix singaporensis TaxID=2799669 RepID=A0A7L6AVY1_9GAMM|nr:MAG: hypothetical protein HZT40_17630 [Candidatus Thiothrix singaporensis]